MAYNLHAYNGQGGPWFTGVTLPWPGAPYPSGDPVAPPTVEDLDAFFAAGLSSAAWEALTPEVKAGALEEAKRWLATLCWRAEGCCGRDFEAALLMATAQLALALATDPTAVTGGPTDGRWVKREKLDVLEQEYGLLGEADGAAAPGSSLPLVIQRFPWLKDILGCWLEVGRKRQIRLLRN